MHRNVLSRGADGDVTCSGTRSDVTDRVAVERSLRETIEQQRDAAVPRRLFGSPLSPRHVRRARRRGQRLPVPFVADAAMVHTRRRRRLGAAHPAAFTAMRRTSRRWRHWRPPWCDSGGSDTLTTSHRRGHGGAGAVVARRPGQGRAVARLRNRTAPAAVARHYVVDEMARRIRLALDRDSALPRGAGGQPPQG